METVLGRSRGGFASRAAPPARDWSGPLLRRQPSAAAAAAAPAAAPARPPAAPRRRPAPGCRAAAVGRAGGVGPDGAGAGAGGVTSGSLPQDEGEDVGYMREYAALKATLLDNTRKAGGALGAYVFLTAGGGPALACMVGAAGSYAYLQLLCADVDAVSGTDRVPIWEANKIENPALKRAAKIAAIYGAALRPRLLVPVGLASAVAVWNALSGAPLSLLYQGCMLGGFLAYKGALLTKLLSELLPKSYGTPGESRPRVERIEDELDQWGRPKKSARTPIDALPLEAQERALQQLEKQAGGEAEREALQRERRARGGAGAGAGAESEADAGGGGRA
ncbi:hypothetical protein Rsub_04718 [Raphidocelis subcapitata]|uniref:Uncharacterized protein n=1 Tax=Raphidocelis subcapitata TaxID=307507 RepID=A0A2V0NWH9_9CHLO|nr:hypothetical protein Rsub_04718 [Raphidocelis subcapitata]|eukprot:GBF91994.1 hypothetical protein Rsub_04718 [Raphidocelis subcapitata]